VIFIKLCYCINKKKRANLKKKNLNVNLKAKENYFKKELIKKIVLLLARDDSNK
jgi:hypothetical protein